MLAQLLEGLLKYIPQKIRDRYKTKKIDALPTFVFYKTSKYKLCIGYDGFIEIWDRPSQLIPLFRISFGVIRILQSTKYLVIYRRGNRIIRQVTPK